MTDDAAARSSLRPVFGEVLMLGRRSYARVSIESGAEGVLSLTRDILVRRRVTGELVAISRDAGPIGERVRVELANREIRAEVIESVPIVCDGAIRHRLVMRPLDSDRGLLDIEERE
jgi:hypothetical protein